jgi:WD40 repeat protein
MNIIDTRNKEIKLYQNKELQQYFLHESVVTNILFHPINPYLFIVYDDNNIIILDINSPKIKCIYQYKHQTKITSCSFNFLGNAIIFSSENKLVILELKLNIVNNNRLNTKTNMIRMLGNISVSTT